MCAFVQQLWLTVIRVGVQQLWLTDDVRRCACSAWWRWPSGVRPHRDRSSSQRLLRYSTLNHLSLSGSFFSRGTIGIIKWSLPSCNGDLVGTSYQKVLYLPPKDLFIYIFFVPVTSRFFCVHAKKVFLQVHLVLRDSFKENVWQPERKYAIVARIRSR